MKNRSPIGAGLDANSKRFAIGASVFFGVMYFVQGLGDPTSGLIAQPVRSLLKNWGESPAAIGGLMALLALPWSFKPLFGLLSDFVPVLGSRRRVYLLAATASAALGLAVVAWVPLTAGERWLLVGLLLLPTVGIAFGDVLVDALMVEQGQPRGLTGLFQSVQWTAAYTALLLTGVVGGYLADRGDQQLAFALGAMLWAIGLAVAWRYARDTPTPLDSETARQTARTMFAVLKQPGFILVCVVLFLWSFNPMWVSVLYLHMTETLGYSELEYGTTYSAFCAGALLGAVSYGVYCWRLAPGRLLHLSILTGAAANAVYWYLPNLNVAYAVSVAAGAAYMTGSLIQMDVAARVIPVRAAATLFATVMALTNIAAAGSEAFGGYVYGALIESGDRTYAFSVVVAISVLCAMSCWMFLPLLKRALPEWWHGDDREAPAANRSAA